MKISKKLEKRHRFRSTPINNIVYKELQLRNVHSVNSRNYAVHYYRKLGNSPLY